MPDALDDAVAKARNAAYSSDPGQLQPADRLSKIPARVAFTTRSFRYLAGPRFPEGIDGNPPGTFSILNETGVRESATAAQNASSFQSVVGFDAFNPQSNFPDSNNVADQYGISFSPGGVPLYKTVNGGRVLVGGLGVSGDLPDPNDTVTARAVTGFKPPNSLRDDQHFVRGVRLPYQKFNRNPDLSHRQPKSATRDPPQLDLCPALHMRENPRTFPFDQS